MGTFYKIIGLILLIPGGIGTYNLWKLKNYTVDFNFHQKPTLYLFVNFIVAVIGMLFLAKGFQYSGMTRKSFKMLRDTGYIDAKRLSRQSGLCELVVRKRIAKFKRKGFIPENTEIK